LLLIFSGSLVLVFSGAQTGVKYFFPVFSISLFCGFSGCFLRLISGRSGPAQIIVDGFPLGFAMVWYFSVLSSMTNGALRTNRIISAETGRVLLRAIRTDEELMVARSALQLLGGAVNKKARALKQRADQTHHECEKSHCDPHTQPTDRLTLAAIAHRAMVERGLEPDSRRQRARSWRSSLIPSARQPVYVISAIGSGLRSTTTIPAASTS
jgi:hypothetical protein